LHDVGPVTNNVVGGPGIRFESELKGLGNASLSAFYLVSTSPIDMYQGGQKVTGDGVYIKAIVQPARLFDVAFIFWRGHNFITQEGDHNYGSIGATAPYYRADRRYEELALIKKFPIARTVDVDAEVRLHDIDGKIEYSYRLLVRAPFDLRVH
jgi:hypothetical protein